MEKRIKSDSVQRKEMVNEGKNLWMKRNEQAKGLESYFYSLSASESQSIIFPVQSKACLLPRIFAGKKRKRNMF